MMADEFVEIFELLDKLSSRINSIDGQHLTKESQQSSIPMVDEVNKVKTSVADLTNRINKLYKYFYNLERRLLNVEGTTERLLSGKR